MKKLIATIAIAMSVSMASANDDRIKITEDKDGAVWAGHISTFNKMSDGASIMISQYEKQKAPVRFFAAMTFDDCRKGFGALYTRGSPNERWEFDRTVELRKNGSIADAIAMFVCHVNASYDEMMK